MLAEQYKLSKVEEAKETTSVKVLDPACKSKVSSARFARRHSPPEEPIAVRPLVRSASGAVAIAMDARDLQPTS